MSRSLKRRLTALSATALLAGAAALGVASPAFAHDELVSVVITNEGSDSSTVDSLKFTFSNNIIEVGTEIIATDADGSSVVDGKPVISGATVTQALQKDLRPGKYSAAWRVVSSDGHPIEGSFGIQVQNDGVATIVDEATAEKDPRFTTEDATHDHAEGEDHETTEQSGLSTGAIVAISVGGVAVLAVVIATVIIGQRRRAQAFGAKDATNTENTDRTEGTEDAR